jgi:hypothetical protein
MVVLMRIKKNRITEYTPGRAGPGRITRKLHEGSELQVGRVGRNKRQKGESSLAPI